jgi:hypothetical protein
MSDGRAGRAREDDSDEPCRRLREPLLAEALAPVDARELDATE